MGLGGQDAFDGRIGVGAVTHGPLQGGQHVGAAYVAKQRQHPLGLVLAVTLAGQQAIQEASAAVAQFREAFLQLGLALAGGLPRADGPCSWRHWPVTDRGNNAWRAHLLEVRTVDDHLGLRDAHRQRLADVPPGHRVAFCR